jgi:pyruvate/2-oxoglutarate dehydrogenase complex dihydrolipoamide dehydrogenase (E3) component
MSRPKHDFDLIILGGGSAGIVSGVVAGSTGLRTLLIEKVRMGGECLNTGCVPSKALLEAAEIAHRMRTADRFGLKAAPVGRQEAAGVLRHVRETIRRVEEADATTKLLTDSGVEIRFGDAAFVGPETIELAEREAGTVQLTSEHFLIATGSRPKLPDIPGLDEPGCLTNQTVFDMDEIPESLIVLGGGPVGVEMALAFQRLGSEVTLIERNGRLLPKDDFETAQVIETALREEGVSLRLQCAVRGVRREGVRKVVRLEEAGLEKEVSAHELLAATGRAPNVEGLDLIAAGVQTGEEGVIVDDTLRTTNPRIWACGDVTGRMPFSHMAEYEARLVVQNILLPFRSKIHRGYRIAPWTTFTDPETAHAGLTEEEARAQNIDYQVYRQPFTQNDRAITARANVGFVKVLATGASGRIIGAHIVGPRAGELIQEWIFAMTHGLSVRQVADTIHVYPTLSTANQHAAYRWYEAQSEKPLVKSAIHAYTRSVRPNLGAVALALGGATILAGGALLRRSLRKGKQG